MQTSAHQRALEEALAELPSAHRRRRRRWWNSLLEWLLVLIALVTTSVAILVLAVVLVERELDRRIYPNISVRGISVGGLTMEQAHSTLTNSFRDLLTQPLELRYGDQVWYPTPADLGLRLRLDEALSSAFALGRGDLRIMNLQRAAAIWQQGFDLPIHLEIDQTRMQRYLLELAAEVERSPSNADLWLDGAEVVVQPERWGTQLLVDEMIRDMSAALQDLEPRTITLRTRTLEPTQRDSRITPVAAELRTLLSAPLTLSATIGPCAPRGCNWRFAPEAIANWISVQRRESLRGDEPAFQVSLDHDAIRKDLQPIAALLREEGTLPEVAWNGGDLIITRAGLPGRALDLEAAVAAVSTLLPTAERSIDLPIQPILPPVHEGNLQSLGITTQVGVGVSSFSRSEQYRITNIVAGARRMHRLLIPPGATFSFNTQLGSVDAANGIVEGLAIINNRTQKEWGGGVCQVSTTVFRAAFFAGLPITERHAHAFRISWYEELDEPPGMDAAIFTPSNDMRFTNDSGGWLLMESYVDLERQRMTVALYGAPSDRRVSYSHRVLEQTPAPTQPVYVNDPTLPTGYLRRTDSARPGLRVELYRTVTRDGAVIARDTFATRFRPWPNIYVRGTGR